MTEAIIIEIIGVLGLIFVAALQLRSERERKRRKQAEEARDKRHEEQRVDDMEMSVVKGRLMLSVGELAYVTSLAVSGGHTNGNVESAQHEFLESKKAYDALETRLAKKYLKS